MHIDPTLYTGRPQNLEGRLPREVACYDLLDRLAINQKLLFSCVSTFGLVL